MKTHLRLALRERQARTVSALSSTRLPYCVIPRQLKVGIDGLETLDFDPPK